MSLHNIGIARAVVVLAAMVLSLPPTASAHKVNIFAYAEGGRVYAEGYFADGGRASECKVTVEDMSGKLLLDGMTDKDGTFSFDIPKTEDLRIVLHAGMGHKNDYVVKAAELRAALPEGNKSNKRTPKADRPAKNKPPIAPSVPSAQAAGTEQQTPLTAEEMRAMVDETVEARLRPLYAMLADMREASGKPVLTDVIGGIGYIIGIMGIIMYFKSRKA